MKLGRRGFLILLVVGLALWQFSYTIKYYKLTPEARATLPVEEFKKLRRKALNLGLDLQGGMHLILRVKAEELTPDERKGARDRALRIIENRINQFGVSEPQIMPLRDEYIVIQLPGVRDPERAKEIIQKTAQLQFRLVEESKKTWELIERIDSIVHAYELSTTTDTYALLPNPVLSLFERGAPERLFIKVEDTSLFNKYLRLPEVRSILSEDKEFLYSKPSERMGHKVVEVLFVDTEVLLTGDAISDARPGIGTAENPLEPRVDLDMKPWARRRWADITGANVGRRIAIILDNVVQSAPVVRERIVGGRSQITMGRARIEDARDLALVIRAGALPAPLEIVEERTVGPTLGSDSVRAGIRAIYIGAIVVFIFMILYYHLSGIIADIAVIINIILILAVLSLFNATLTLPGIAGLVLVVGTSVDANVLIFERIREELAAGKTLKTAISAGFGNAFRTILDANLTTLLMAVILYFFGTGPIKGFGVTLSIGILANFFTAIVFTRFMLDWITSFYKVPRFLM